MKVSGSSFYMLGFVATLVHAFNHSIMKVLMFMCAGSIMHGTGSKNLELFGGLARKCRIPLSLLSSARWRLPLFR